MIEILQETTKNPLQKIGQVAGVCWNGDITDSEKNKKRALDCIRSNHGRTLEYVDVELVLDGYSAKMIRELYTHIGGSPTRLQSSTRYLDYSKGFDAVIPESVERNENALQVWNKAIDHISESMKELKTLGVPVEDLTNLLPLAYKTKMVWKVNLRTLANFMNQRMCNRAYWEIKKFAYELKRELSAYSDEWEKVADLLFVPKCERDGFCTETKCCGRKPKKQ